MHELQEGHNGVSVAIEDDVIALVDGTCLRVVGEEDDLVRVGWIEWAEHWRVDLVIVLCELKKESDVGVLIVLERLAQGDLNTKDGETHAVHLSFIRFRPGLNSFWIRAL